MSVSRLILDICCPQREYHVFIIRELEKLELSKPQPLAFLAGQSIINNALRCEKIKNQIRKIMLMRQPRLSDCVLLRHDLDMMFPIAEKLVRVQWNNSFLVEVLDQTFTISLKNVVIGYSFSNAKKWAEKFLHLAFSNRMTSVRFVIKNMPKDQRVEFFEQVCARVRAAKDVRCSVQCYAAMQVHWEDRGSFVNFTPGICACRLPADRN